MFVFKYFNCFSVESEEIGEEKERQTEPRYGPYVRTWKRPPKPQMKYDDRSCGEKTCPHSCRVRENSELHRSFFRNKNNQPPKKPNTCTFNTVSTQTTNDNVYEEINIMPYKSAMKPSSIYLKNDGIDSSNVEKRVGTFRNKYANDDIYETFSSVNLPAHNYPGYKQGKGKRVYENVPYTLPREETLIYYPTVIGRGASSLNDNNGSKNSDFNTDCTDTYKIHKVAVDVHCSEPKIPCPDLSNVQPLVTNNNSQTLGEKPLTIRKIPKIVITQHYDLPSDQEAYMKQLPVNYQNRQMPRIYQMKPQNYHQRNMESQHTTPLNQELYPQSYTMNSLSRQTSPFKYGTNIYDRTGRNHQLGTDRRGIFSLPPDREVCEVDPDIYHIRCSSGQAIPHLSQINARSRDIYTSDHYGSRDISHYSFDRNPFLRRHQNTANQFTGMQHRRSSLANNNLIPSVTSMGNRWLSADRINARIEIRLSIPITYPERGSACNNAEPDITGPS